MTDASDRVRELRQRIIASMSLDERSAAKKEGIDLGPLHEGEPAARLTPNDSLSRFCHLSEWLL